MLFRTPPPWSPPRRNPPHQLYRASSFWSFAEFSRHLVSTSPIGGIVPPCHSTSKGREWPIFGVVSKTMLDRVKMDIIDVTLEISLISYRVLPKSPLPDSPFALGNPGGGPAFIGAKSGRETALDKSPSRRKIGVVLRQRPHRMQVIRQHNPCVDGTGTVGCGRAPHPTLRVRLRARLDRPGTAGMGARRPAVGVRWVCRH